MTFSSWIDDWSKKEGERTVVYAQVILETDPVFHGKILFGLLSLIATTLIIGGSRVILSLSTDPAVAGLVGGSLIWFWMVMGGAVKADRLTKERMKQKGWKEAVQAHQQSKGAAP